MIAAFGNENGTQIIWTDSLGAIWRNIPCRHTNGEVVIDSDGQIASEVKLWISEGNTVAPYVAPPVDLRAYAADKRWRVETGGIPFGGMVIPSDDRAKTLIMGAANAMADAATAPFVIGSSAVTFTGSQFKAAHAAIVAHVQACFAKQAELLAAINAGTITTTQQIDSAAWPSNG